MPPTKKSFSYLMVCLIVLLLVSGLSGKKDIVNAFGTPEGGNIKDFESTTLRFDTNMLVHSDSCPDRLYPTTAMLERAILGPLPRCIRNWDVKEISENATLTASFTISLEVLSSTINDSKLFTLNVLIENIGGSDVENVTVTIVLPSSLTSNATSQRLGTIFACGAGGVCKAPVSFTILAKEPGTFTITVAASATNSATVSDSITVTVLPFQTKPPSDDDNIPGFTVVSAFLGLSALTFAARSRKNNS